jgi:hypothetical protein
MNAHRLAATFSGGSASLARLLLGGCLVASAGACADTTASSEFTMPVITALSPDTAVVGTSRLTVTINGTGFGAPTYVIWEGVERRTTVVSSTHLTVTLDSADMARASVATVTVINPLPGGRSEPATFPVLNPLPAIEETSTLGATAGSAGFVLSVDGSGFIPESVARWNGEARPTTYVDPWRLDVRIDAADVASPGTGAVTVVNPSLGGGESAPVHLRVRPLPASTLTSLVTVELPSWGMGYAADRLYLLVDGSAPGVGNTLTRVDPATGTMEASVPAGGRVDRLAMAHDGSYAYVSLPDERGVRRFLLPSMAADLWIQLPDRVRDMKVLPWAPRSLLLATTKTGSSIHGPFGEAGVYDDGVRRPGVLGTSAPPDSSFFGAAVDVFAMRSRPGIAYAKTSALFELSLTSFGIRRVRHLGELPGLGQLIWSEGGRVYGQGGAVVDPVRASVIGNVGDNLGVWADVPTGRIFLHRPGRVEVYDLNTLEHLAQIPVPGLSSLFWTPAEPLRWGADGLALLSNDRVFILRTPLLLQ